MEDLACHSFDFINTEQVIEHVPEPLVILKELGKLLRPGGVLKVSVPNGRTIKKKLLKDSWSEEFGSRNDLNPVQPLCHINCFSSHSLNYCKAGRS